MSDTSNYTSRRWTDSTKIIYLLMSLVGGTLTLLGTLSYLYITVLIDVNTERVIDNRDAIKGNATSIARIESLMSLQVEKINTVFSAHLQDPTIHHAGRQNMGARLDMIMSEIQSIRKAQAALIETQAIIGAELQLIKNVIEKQ